MAAYPAPDFCPECSSALAGPSLDRMRLARSLEKSLVDSGDNPWGVGIDAVHLTDMSKELGYPVYRVIVSLSPLHRFNPTREQRMENGGRAVVVNAALNEAMAKAQSRWSIESTVIDPEGVTTSVWTLIPKGKVGMAGTPPSHPSTPLHGYTQEDWQADMETLQAAGFGIPGVDF